MHWGSLPSWERGLKYVDFYYFGCAQNVAPFVGAWIEIYLYYYTPQRADMSLPSWERGLKFVQSWQLLRCDCVAPFVGAWIEIKVKKIF